MYVMVYMMGPIDAPISKVGVEITDSLYVVVNMIKMTRMGDDVLLKVKQGADFILGLHSVGAPLKENQIDVSWPCAPMEEKIYCTFS